MSLETGLIIGTIGMGWFIYEMSKNIEPFVGKHPFLNMVMKSLRALFQYFAFSFIWIIPTAMLNLVSLAETPANYWHWFNIQLWSSRLFWLVFTPIYLTLTIFFLIVQAMEEVKKK